MNWYKLSQEALEKVDRPDISKVTPQQWNKICDRMLGLGYDFHGWADTKRIYERLNVTTGGLPDDHKNVLGAVLNDQEYIKEYTPQKIRGTFQKAINYFGLTSNLRECGYILPNGSMLDLSGRKMGAMTGESRGLDHHEVNDIMSMPEFIKMGAIRHFPEQPGVDIRKNPTPQQLNVIWRDVEGSGNGYVVEIIDLVKGRFYQQYDVGTKASKVIQDIVNFYGGRRACSLAFPR